MTAQVPDGVKAEVDRILVERRIEKVLQAYCQGVDRKDWEQVRACYHDDALDNHGTFVGSPDDLLTWLQENHGHVTSSLHVLSNVSMCFSDGGKLARVESYCLSVKAISSAADDPYLGASGRQGLARRTVANRYIDTFEDRPGVGWRILRRDVVLDWLKREPDEHYMDIDPNWTISLRDRSDPLYAPLVTPKPCSLPSL